MAIEKTVQKLRVECSDCLRQIFLPKECYPITREDAEYRASVLSENLHNDYGCELADLVAVIDEDEITILDLPYWRDDA